MGTEMRAEDAKKERRPRDIERTKEEWGGKVSIEKARKEFPCKKEVRKEWGRKEGVM